ncbi:MAG: cytochrome c oxidase accessory protein CcoG [Pseudomonadales bacterium]|nr:cytochrome c oxidase accessory protein CcoG [Pseudomonadales bacterium]
MSEPATNDAELVVLKGFDQVDLYQRREKIYTRGVSGFYQRLRLLSGWPFLIVYFATPWINWNSHQAVLFDLPARQFHIFGLTAWPQELWLLGWMLIIAAFALFTLTTFVGRVWCGYTCPQTIWTAVFMWLEQVTEGQRHQRIRLETAPWSLEKVAKRIAKHLMWLGFAMLTGIAFVAYFTPVRELVPALFAFDIDGWRLFWIAFFTCATYLNAGWMREQVCIYMCPYARFQSAMFDEDTLVVSYNDVRGDPRGSRKRGQAKQSSDSRNALGDCIDCQLCVQVCPTGIDIREGLQYQCISCAACIDACDQVMEKMGYATRLISYTTERVLHGGVTRWVRGRSVGYSGALLLMLVAFASALINRDPFAIDIIRERGELYHTLADGSVRNDYQLKVMNRQQSTVVFELKLHLSDEHFSSVSKPIPRVELLSTRSFDLLAGGLENVPLLIKVTHPVLANFPVTLNLCEAGTDDCVSEETRFIAPQSSIDVGLQGTAETLNLAAVNGITGENI